MKFSSRTLLHLIPVFVLTLCCGSMGSAQNFTKSDSQRVEEEYSRFFDNTIEISASTFEQATSDYVHLVTGKSFPEKRKLQLSLAEAQILCGIVSGQSSELFPIVIKNHSDQVFDLPISHLHACGVLLCHR